MGLRLITSQVSTWSDSTVIFVLPNAPVGPNAVVLSTTTGRKSNSIKISVLGAGPVIESNLPSTTPGSMFVLKGQNFGQQPQFGTSSLTFGVGIIRDPVQIITWTDTHIAFIIPPTTQKGTSYVTVTTLIGDVNSGFLSSSATATIRVRDVAAIVNYDACSNLLGSLIGLADTCPPLLVSTAKGINGTIDITLENNTSKWYSLSITESGGAIIPGALFSNIVGSRLIRTTRLVAIGPHGKYKFPGVVLPQVGSVRFAADATTNLAKIAFMLDYGSAAICTAEGVSGCPRLPADLDALEPFLDTLAGPFSPAFVRAELEIYNAFVSRDAYSFASAVGSLIDLINSDRLIYKQFQAFGFSAGTLTDLSSGANILLRIWKAFELFGDIILSINEDTSGGATIVGR